MRCFVALEEDLLMELWLLDPDLVAPFSITPEKASLLTVNTTTTLVEPSCPKPVEGSKARND
jgi:hypothetical protein